MGRLRDWWERLTGSAAAAAEPRPAAKSQPKAGPNQPTGELTLADEAARGKASRVGAAGFDPYASDAGYSKPHSWERIDHD
ncbi:MAG: hypothetical protein NDI84_17865 [Steroidobacteraceae bacterium]|nr:hypothetical protein [Steroidobacteraceae bacterium]